MFTKAGTWYFIKLLLNKVCKFQGVRGGISPSKKNEKFPIT